MGSAGCPGRTWCMPAGHVAGSLPAGLAPTSPSRTLAMARPVAWAGKKHARMAPTPSCACAQLTSRGPALNSSRMTGRPAAAGRQRSSRPHSSAAQTAPGCPMDGARLGGLRFPSLRPSPSPSPLGWPRPPGHQPAPRCRHAALARSRAPTRLHGILQQLQLVARQGQVPPVLRLRLHIRPCVGTAKGQPLTPCPGHRGQMGQRGTDRLRGPMRTRSSPRAAPDLGCSPSQAVPTQRLPRSHLPVPRQTTTTSAAPAAPTTSAREYCWHCGSRQPAAKLRLAGSVSSPLLHQERAEGLGHLGDAPP